MFTILHISRISCVSHFRIFAYFAFSDILCILRSRTFRISRSCIFRISHTHISRAFHIFAYFAFHISHSCIFCALTHATMHLLGSIAFHSHVLSSSSEVNWCVFHFVSLALHHVFTFPFMFTYLVMCLYYITLVHLVLPTWLQALGTRLAC